MNTAIFWIYLRITNNEEIISDTSIHSKNDLIIKSDHYPVSCKLTFSAPGNNHEADQKSIQIYDNSRGDYDGLNDFLHNTDFSSCYQSDNVEFVWQFIISTLLDAITSFIPSFTITPNSHPKWFTSHLRHQLKCIPTLRRRYRNSPTDYIKIRLEMTELQFTHDCLLAKSTFETNLISNLTSGDQRGIYQYIRNISKSDSIPPTIYYNDYKATDDYGKATLFNQFFHSVFTHSKISLPPDADILDPSVKRHLVSITILKLMFLMLYLH